MFRLSLTILGMLHLSDSDFHRRVFDITRLQCRTEACHCKYVHIWIWPPVLLDKYLSLSEGRKERKYGLTARRHRKVILRQKHGKIRRQLRDKNHEYNACNPQKGLKQSQYVQ
jgi:hypothetical protein